MKPIEDALGAPLFIARKGGGVCSSAMGERLFTDTGGIEKAMDRLMEKVSEIREARVLRVGANAATFRTDAFRRVFRVLGSFDDFRLAYVPIAESDSASALTQGRCDWYFGFHHSGGERIITEQITQVPLRVYRRSSSSQAGAGMMRGGCITPEMGGRSKSYPSNVRLQPEIGWDRYFENPDECADGRLICAPEISVDPKFWRQEASRTGDSEPLALLGMRLRYHPYEFLPGLADRLKQRLFDAPEA
ncbi:MAG: hypothetical protein ABJZ54_03450 [Luteolibacter sp.]